jgi:hypothetical protein
MGRVVLETESCTSYTSPWKQGNALQPHDIHQQKFFSLVRSCDLTGQRLFLLSQSNILLAHYQSTFKSLRHIGWNSLRHIGWNSLRHIGWNYVLLKLYQVPINVLCKLQPQAFQQHIRTNSNFDDSVTKNEWTTHLISDNTQKHFNSLSSGRRTTVHWGNLRPL